MKINEETHQIMESEGWIIACTSPLEIEHENGSRLTHMVAQAYITATVAAHTRKSRRKKVASVNLGKMSEEQASEYMAKVVGETTNDKTADRETGRW